MKFYFSNKMDCSQNIEPINTTQNKISISFELMRRTKKPDNILKIKQITKSRILILYDEFFEVYNIKTGQLISITKENLESNCPIYYDNYYKNFIELKNKDLILWSRGKIFYYKKTGNNYKLSQVIYEVEQQKNKTDIWQIGEVDKYNLYNIIELDNNILLSCNSIGLKIYNFIENEYKLINVFPMFLDVENVIQLRENNFLVIHHYTYYSGGCMLVTYHKFGLSLFDLKSNKTKKIFNDEIKTDYDGSIYYNFNYFLLKDTFIYQISDFSDNDKNYKKKMIYH